MGDHDDGSGLEHFRERRDELLFFRSIHVWLSLSLGGTLHLPKEASGPAGCALPRPAANLSDDMKAAFRDAHMPCPLLPGHGKPCREAQGAGSEPIFISADSTPAGGQIPVFPVYAGSPLTTC
ncbi:hypothetical protein XFLAVUS301_27960 [Xanthobacter flavus]|uniref:Uncharacterized protein n=1 Tax=Xanthobacter flavus TaxID=281 RepID=A0A9W6CPW5_XANFL|nr:hypothetical protein XFLAVUS301_27960 [Xanthobacter flavus]